jgi:outer membrane protein assembly factor BamB
MPRGRLAIVAGDPEPRAWIIGPSGQIEGSPLLPAPPEADPVVIGDRLIVPMPGRLQAVRISSQPAVQDLLLPTGEVHPWLHLLATGADRALAVTRDGLLLNIRLVTSGRAHIAEAGRMELGSAVELKLGGNAKFAAVADQAGRLTILDAERFEQLGQRTLPQPLTSPPVVVDDLVLAAVGNSQLVAIQAATDLPNRWSIPLPGCGITGAALTPAGLVVCLEQGQVWLLDPATGALSQEMDVGSPIVMGPTDTPYGVLLSTLDNTVVPITFAGGAP